MIRLNVQMGTLLIPMAIVSTMTTPEEHKAMMDAHAIAAAERVVEEAENTSTEDDD
jgi:hypothetical protein